MTTLQQPKNLLGEADRDSSRNGLTRHDGRPFDILHIIDASGTERQIYVDISSYFGKL